MKPKSELILYQTEDNRTRIEVRLENETVWLTQGQMAELFQTTKQNVSLHIQNILKEKELLQDSVVKEFLTTAADGKTYDTQHYNLDVIIAVGYRVKSHRGTQFRQWATQRLREYPGILSLVTSTLRSTCYGGRVDSYRSPAWTGSRGLRQEDELGGDGARRFRMKRPTPPHNKTR